MFRCTVVAVVLLVFSTVCAWGAKDNKPQVEATPQADVNAPDVDGIIVDDSGKPVKKAEVILLYSDGDKRLYSRIVERVKTNRKGKFEFAHGFAWPENPQLGDRKPRPSLRVAAYHPKKGFNFAVMHPDDSGKDLRITLRKLYPCYIKVTDIDGKPVAGAKFYSDSFELEKEDRKDLAREHWHLSVYKDIGLFGGMTDEDGRAKVDAPYKARFCVERDGYTKGYWGGKTLLLCPSAKVAGKVTLPDGKPAAGAFVEYEYGGESLIWNDNCLTDAEGKYAFPNVAAKGHFFDIGRRAQEEAGQGSAMITVTVVGDETAYASEATAFEVKPGDSITKDIALKPACMLGGTVTDLVTGKPVPNIKCYVFFETGGRYSNTKEIQTDATGKFLIPVPPDKQFSMQWQDYSEEGDFIMDDDWLQHGNWQPFKGLITESKTDMDLKVKLIPSQPLKGKVVGEDGTAVKGARVFVTSRVKAATTDADGTFAMKAVPKEKDFELYAQTEGGSLAGIVGVKAGATEAALTVKPTQKREGLVLTKEGLPAADFTFWFQPMAGKEALYTLQETLKTDKDGKFVAEHVCPDAKYKVFWGSDNEDNRDYSSSNNDVILTCDKPFKFEVSQLLNTMMGRVLDTDGKPIAGATVADASNNYYEQGNTTTNEKGEFELTRLPYGDVKLRVSAEGRKVVTLTKPSDTIDLEVKLPPASEPIRTKVTVVDEAGKPFPNAPLTVVQPVYGEEGASWNKKVVRTDKQGVATITYPPPDPQKPTGERLIILDMPGYDYAFHRCLRNADSEGRLTAWKQTAPWHGKVIGPDGKPVAGAIVTVTNATKILKPGELVDGVYYWGLDNPFIGKYTTDSEGKFTLERFNANYRIMVNAKAAGFSGESPERWPKDPSEELMVKLCPAAVITGKIIDKATGKPIEGATAFCYRKGDRGWSGKCGKDGTFKIEGLKVGRYVLSGHKKTYVCRKKTPVDLEVGKPVDFTIEIEEGIPVAGRVVDKATGKPPAQNAAVVVANNEGHVTATEVEKDGTWKAYVWDGDFTFRVQGPNMSQQSEVKRTIARGKNEEIVLEVVK